MAFSLIGHVALIGALAITVATYTTAKVGDFNRWTQQMR